MGDLWYSIEVHAHKIMCQKRYGKLIMFRWIRKEKCVHEISQD